MVTTASPNPNPNPKPNPNPRPNPNPKPNPNLELLLAEGSDAGGRVGEGKPRGGGGYALGGELGLG